jgi:hypothetical protein
MQRLPGDIRPFAVAQANDVDERPDWRIDADRQLLVDDEVSCPMSNVSRAKT